MSVRRVKYRDRKTGAEKQSWIVDIYIEHADGSFERVRKAAPVQTKRAAEAYERQLRQMYFAKSIGMAFPIVPAPPPVTPEPRKEVPTFNEFVEKRWWPTYPKAAGNRHTTILEKDGHLRLYLKPFFGSMRLDNIRQETVERFYAKLTADDLAPKTRKNVGATLRRILASAEEWEVIEKVPRFPRVKCPETPFDFYVKEESDACIAAARNAHERAILTFAFHTGARAGEQLAFEWGDIDWKSHKVIFRSSSSHGVVGPTKSGKGRRVPMSETLETALRQIKHLRGPLVFCREDGSPMTIWQFHEPLYDHDDDAVCPPGAGRRAGAHHQSPRRETGTCQGAARQWQIIGRSTAIEANALVITCNCL
jgi:integrase